MFPGVTYTVQMRPFSPPNGDFSDLLENIGSLIETQTRVRLEREKTTPDGAAWKPLSAAYAAWKARHFPNGSLLIREGHMRDSITYAVSGRTSVEIGATVNYGVYQNGEREFLGISDDNETEIRELIDDWITDVMGGGK